MRNLPVDHFGILLTLLAEAWQQGDQDAARALRLEILQTRRRSLLPSSQGTNLKIRFTGRSSLYSPSC